MPELDDTGARISALSGAIAPLAESVRRRLSDAPSLSDEAVFVLALSDFAMRYAVSHPEWLQAYDAESLYCEPTRREDIIEACKPLRGATSIDALKAQLRQLRNQFMVRIIWRHVTARAPMEETVAALSHLADACIDTALTRLHIFAVEQNGEPCDTQGNPQRLVVFALGKLGGRELNLSSDIDLIFGYPAAGQTQGTGITCQQFFLRLGRELIDALDTVTADGFVFRVDMRLRPFGDSGPLVMHFAALESYYETEGRDWERYATIKARVCAGDKAAGRALLQRLAPFVYRRYLDFGAIEAMRDMHRRMLAERGRGQYRNDIKLGRGGIRDAEFVVQMQQLVWGGRETTLQQRSLLPVAAELLSLGRLDAAHVDPLVAGYRFLRDAEHCLQAINDQQTQQLPTDATQQLRVAVGMGFESWDRFESVLETHREAIAGVFHDNVLSESSDAPTGEGPPEAEATSGLAELWPPDAVSDEQLQAHGFVDAEEARVALLRLDGAARKQAVGREGQARLDRLMPHLLADVVQTRFPDRALARIIPVLRSVLRRSAYLMLLCENSAARRQFVALTLDSKWLADQLVRYPVLLDTLLNIGDLKDVPLADVLQSALQARLDRLNDDEERQADELREFKQFHTFSVAAAEVSGTLPLMRASDYLTHVAEAVLRCTLDLAWRQTAPRFEDDVAPLEGRIPFLIVGYGKLGGIELGHGSDLDLVFLHDLPPSAGRFLQRFTQRLLHLLNIRTVSGPLYEIDARLRPGGNKAPMVASVDRFRRYQQEEAWVWEHQALVRSRVVAGDAALARRFDKDRLAILCQTRDRETLKAEVVSMRERMHTQGSSRAAEIKLGRGGIVDIEFMVQYLVLAWAHVHPQLAVYPDNTRILEAVADTGILPADECRRLTDAYHGLRSESHRRELDIPDQERQAKVLAQYRDVVRASWQLVFGSDDV